MKEMIERNKKSKSLPVFDIEKIPAEIIKQCIEIMYAPESAKGILAEPEDIDTFGKPMIYLGWLYANNFMVSDGVMPVPIEGFSFDFDDYELEDGGINLQETIESYNLEETVPLLKGLLIND